MEIKLVARTLGVFELFAQQARPLSLTELSRALDVPMSSTLALVRTLLAKGYLYEVRKRGGYYPTRRMLAAAAKINAADPVLQRVHPALVRLRDTCDETVVLGKCQQSQVIYLASVPSTRPIRYMAEAGDIRPVQANSIGKAVFSMLSRAEQQRIAASLDWTPLTERTIASADDLFAEAERCARRGWSENLGESVADLAAMAMPLKIGGEWYGISVVGPRTRMQARWKQHLADLQAELAQIRQAFQADEVASP